jgi:hypothetical protein
MIAGSGCRLRSTAGRHRPLDLRQGPRHWIKLKYQLHCLITGQNPANLFRRYQCHHFGVELKTFAEGHTGSQAPNHGGHAGPSHRRRFDDGGGKRRLRQMAPERAIDQCSRATAGAEVVYARSRVLSRTGRSPPGSDLPANVPNALRPAHMNSSSQAAGPGPAA